MLRTTLRATRRSAVLQPARRLLSSRAQSILSSLGLPTEPEQQDTPGLYDGTWSHGKGQVVESYNPANGELLARVRGCTSDQVRSTIKAAREAYGHWRTVPAPQRGIVLQDIGRALEQHKDALGAVVSLEMGKIKSEGRGEVQEIVDIVGYAVGLSRSIGGTVLPSERKNHFITEVSNPLGVVGVVSVDVGAHCWHVTHAD